MNASMMANYRGMIESELAQLNARDRELRADLLEDTEKKPNILQEYSDHAQAEGSLNSQLEIHEQRIRRRIQLQNALTRISNGIFGVCTKCSEDIAERRLMAQPHAACCVDCQKSDEERSVNGSESELVAWITRREFFGRIAEAA